MTETKRRQGYYLYSSEGQELQLPAVSTIMRSVGNATGLLLWATNVGAWGAHQALSQKIKDGGLVSLDEIKEAAQQALNRERERTAGYGTRVHKAIEQCIKNEAFNINELSPEEQVALQTFMKWYSDVGFAPLHSEATVFNPKDGYAGTIDLALSLSQDQAAKLRPYLLASSETPEEGIVIADFKTGTLYPKTEEVKLAAYAMAYEQTYGSPVNGAMLVNIKREDPESVYIHYIGKDKIWNAYHRGMLTAIFAWQYFDAPKWYLKQFEVEND